MIRLSGVVKHLIIINVLFFFATQLMGEPAYGNITELSQLGRMRLALYYPSSPFFEPFQLVTHMFMHATLSHLFFNMMGLFFFGPPLEQIWGEKKFLIYYFITGFGALGIYLLSKYVELNYLGAPISTINIPMLGASGAISGVVIGYAMKFPNSIVQLL
ncbi:MAG TPA: rhomboid family intramembrane serine protease, partial [Saprospiraceae bacterium]|nr:rhomboid family intramembrane serine protease [Saprospiraceae bacterium]